MNLRYRISRGLLVLLLALALGLTVSAWAQDLPAMRVVYFYSLECEHCMEVLDNVLVPLQAQYGNRMEVKLVEISDPDRYGMLLEAERMFDVPPERRDIPILVVGGEVLVGETEITADRLRCLFDACQAGGTAWPAITGLEEIPVGLEVAPSGGDGLGGGDLSPPWSSGSGSDLTCPEDESAGVCTLPIQTIHVAYFYEVGCDVCNRAEYDLRYAQSEYPEHLVVEKYDIRRQTALAEWLGERYDVPEDEQLSTPILFVGEDYLVGTDITADAVLALVDKYALTGTERVWEDYDPAEGEQRLIERFEELGIATVVFGGLVDGLNPCAFATLVFFVSYLSLSGRKGRQILTVGIAFTLGVFLAYLSIGLGFYTVLELLGPWLDRLERWVYGFMGLFCAVLAVFSFLDYLKARRGEIKDMALNLPHGLRMRINAVIRRGRRARAFVIGAFFTGIAVSFLELACTGQVYVPIIFALSRPAMRSRALVYLVIYNLLFILPLVVVFLLTHFGTSSKQLSDFLQERAAAVKLGMTVLFAALALWLLASVLAIPIFA